MADASPPPPAPKRSWRELHLWQIQPIRDVLVIAAVVLILRLGYVLSLVTVPMLLALLLAYLFEPVILRMTRIKRVNRQVAAGSIIVAAIVLIIVPLVFAIGFAAVQGVAYAQSLAKNVDLVIRSSQEPENDQLRQELPNDSWIWIRDKLAEWREQERLAREEAESKFNRPKGETDPSATDPDSAGTGADEGAEVPPAGVEPPAVPPGDASTEEDPDRPVRIDPSGNPIEEEPASASRVPGERSLASLSDMVLRWLRDNAAAIGANAAKSGATAVNAALQGVMSIGKLLFMGFLTAFFFFFFSTGWGQVRRFWRNLIPEKRRSRTLELLSKMDRVVSGFVRGRLTISAIQTLVFTVGYWLVGVPVPLILGPVVGILSIVPYVGLLGVPITVVAMFLDPQPHFAWQEAWWWALAGPFLVFQIGQILDDYVLTPIIQGKSTDMDAPAILFASISGGVLAGVYGLLLAIPVAACIKILMHEVVWPRVKEWTEGRASDPLPLGRASSPDSSPPPPHNTDV